MQQPDTRRLAGVISAPSIAQLSSQTGLDPAEVALALADLEARGWVFCHGDVIALFDGGES